VRFLRITDLDDGKIDWSAVPGLENAAETERYLLSDGDFVFARSGSVEKAARVVTPPTAVFASYLIRGRPKDRRIADWLAYFIRSADYLEQIRERAAGIGLSNVNASKFSSVSLPLPPLPEQRRIVTKLDSLTGRTARAREQLGRIPKLIQKYRGAILSAAFSGELTREWRKVYRPSHTPQFTPKTMIDARTANLEVLPDKWAWAAFGDTSSVGGGLTKNSKREALPLKVPYLRVANVYANELRLNEITEIGCTPAEFSKTRLGTGDLLIVEGNGSIDQIGRVAIWSSEIEGCSHQNHIIRARMNAGFDPKYALFWLISPAGRNAIERVASSSSGLHTLSISKVSSLPFPVCSSSEQQEIVRRIETAFVWLDRITAEHSSASRLLPRLDQAILANAFRGELVPQDPNDKPLELSATPAAEAMAVA